MGFNNHGFGNIHECKIQDGYIFDIMPISGSVYRYPTRLPVNIPAQTNIFVSDTVAFLLYHEDKVYIGRFDGIISIYRESDMLLVGLNNWDPPAKPYVRQIGMLHCPTGFIPLQLDMRDKLTIYNRYKRAEGRLTAPFDATEYTLGNNEVVRDWSDVQLVTEGGEVYGIDCWNIQDSLWRQNCPVYL